MLVSEFWTPFFPRKSVGCRFRRNTNVIHVSFRHDWDKLKGMLSFYLKQVMVKLGFCMPLLQMNYFCTILLNTSAITCWIFFYIFSIFISRCSLSIQRQKWLVNYKFLHWERLSWSCWKGWMMVFPQSINHVIPCLA